MASTGRSGGAMRTIQKKMRAVVKALLQKQEIHDMLEAIDEKVRPTEMAFLVDDGRITEYGDDIAAFKSDAEVAFKAFARIRGRSRDSTELHNYFLQLVKEQIEDELVGDNADDAADRAAKKRGRTSDASEGAAEDHSSKKKAAGKSRKEETEDDVDEGGVAEMSNAQRNALKAVVRALMKHEVSEPFLYPVDSSVFPEYYELIKKPMDLHTALEKITSGELTTVEGSIAALKLIWGNCRKFNAEGSEISNWADEIESYMNELIEDKLGSEYVHRGGGGGGGGGRKSTSGKAATSEKEKEEKKEGGSSASSSASASASSSTGTGTVKPKAKKQQQQQQQKGDALFIDLPRKTLRTILNGAKSSEFAGPFLSPVNPDEAPGYLDIVSEPMDISTVESKLKAGTYDDNTRQFLDDMKLISENCLAYNDPESEIAKWAVKFGQDFEAAYVSARDAAVAAAPAPAPAVKSEKATATAAAAAVGDDDNNDNKSARANALASALNTKRIDLGTTGKALYKIWKEVSKDPRSEPFRLPVDVAFVPGYTDIVKTPMDLSTIRSQLETYEYSPVRFLRDLRLVFDNCMAYNEPGSLIYQSAEDLKKLAEEMYSTSFPNDALAKKPTAAATAPAPAAAAPASAPSTTSVAKPVPAVTAKASSSGEVVKTEAKPHITPIAAAAKVESKPAAAAAGSGGSSAAASVVPVKTAHVPGGFKPLSPLPSVSMASLAPFLNQNPYTTSNVATAYAYGVPVPAPVPAPKFATHIYIPNEVPVPLTPATAVHPVNRSSTASLLPTTIAKLDKPLNELERLLQELESPRGHRYPEVKERAVNKAKEVIPAIATPCLTESGLHEILSFGEIVTNSGFAFPHTLYPRNFSSKRTIKLFIVPKDSTTVTSSSAPLQFLPVEFTSTINAGDPSTSLFPGIKPTFTVTVDGGTIVAEGTTPREAWTKALTRGEVVLKVIGSKLRRCRAVLYRLCINPLIVYFLEQFPPTAAGGADYYRVITSPMWLREVYNRLNDGSYDNEYDFAWDVRLIFSNCMTYNLPGSDLYNAAQTLSEEFEHLLCNWVYNVQDHSILDFAKGAWDEWNYLKYFDAADPKENFCRATGTRASESELFDCCSCEDQYLKSLTDKKGCFKKFKKGPDGEVNVPDTDTWMCQRCDTARSAPLAVSLTGVLKPYTFAGVSYSREDYGGNFYVPVNDFGVIGWCQARRMRRGGLKNSFLSPLGYEFQSKEEAQQHMEFEKTVHENLLVNRANEYKEYELAKKQQRHAKQRSGGHRRSNRSSSRSSGKEEKEEEDSKDAATSSTASAAAPAAAAATAPPAVLQEEEGLIYVGKLANFTLPEDHRIAFCTALSTAEAKTVRNEGASATAATAATAVGAVVASGAASGGGAGGGKAAAAAASSNLAPALFPIPAGTVEVSPVLNLPRVGGLFGLDEHDVRLAIETLPNASTSCADYQFTYAIECRDQLIAQIKTEISRSGEKANIEKKLKAAVCKERWFWERSKADFRKPGLVASVIHAAAESGSGSDLTISATPWSTHKPGFSRLFPEYIDDSEGEFLLCVWDFLDVMAYATDPSFSLVELVKAITPLESNSNAPTLNQTIFDELCCFFTTILLKDFQRGIAQSVSEQEWQDILLVKPLNVITWPFVARCLLLVLRQNFTAKEATSVINAPATDHDMMLQDDIMCLLLSHPLIHHFSVSGPLIHNFNVTGKVDDVISKKSLGKDGGPRSIYSVRRRCLIDVLGDTEDEKYSELIYEDISEFANDLRGVFLDAIATDTTTTSSSTSNSTSATTSAAASTTESASATASGSDGVVPVPTPKHYAAKAILAWLDGLLTRWGVNYTATAGKVDMEVVEEAEQGNDDSPHALHRLGSPSAISSSYYFRNNYLDPFGFSNRYEPNALKDQVKATYTRDMKALQAFETTLKILRSNEDPESWSKADRVAVVGTLVDKIASGYAFKWAIGRTQETSVKFDLNSVADVPEEPAAVLPSTESFKVTSKTPDYKCRYSGAESKVFNDAASKWVSVPDVLLSPPAYTPSGPFAATASHSSTLFSSIANNWSELPEDDGGSHGTSSAAAASGSSSSTVVPTSTSTTSAAAAAAAAAAGAHDDSTAVAAVVAQASAPEDSRRSSRALRTSRKPMNRIALESAFKRVAAAREAAHYHRMKTESVLTKMVDFLLHRSDFYAQSSPTAMIDALRPLSDSRALPLGIDRYGNEYWLFWAQRRMTIQLLGDAIAAHSTPDKPLNPCVITREPGGWWGVHSGRDLKNLLDSFSAEYLCETVLRESIIEHLHYCKKHLYATTLRLKFLQREWFERQAHLTRTLEASPFTIPEGTDTVQAVKLLETYWAKCLEPRSCVHVGLFFKLEDDPQERTTRRAEQEAMQRRVRKLRDTFADEVQDLHVSKGWLRIDNIASVRYLHASTTASRIHADPLAVPLVLNSLSKSKFLLSHLSESAKPTTTTTTMAAVPAAAAATAAAAASVSLPRADSQASVQDNKPKIVPLSTTTLSAQAPSASDGTAAATATATATATTAAVAATAAPTAGTTVGSAVAVASATASAAVAFASAFASAVTSAVASAAVADGTDTAMEVEEKPAGDEEGGAAASAAAAAAAASSVPVSGDSSESLTGASTGTKADAGDITEDASVVSVSAAAEAEVEAEGSPRPPSEALSESPRPSEAPSSPCDMTDADDAIAAAAAAKEVASFRPFTQSAAAASSNSNSNSNAYGDEFSQYNLANIAPIRVKQIEQLHIVTGEVLRVYPSGREAAAYMDVSQSGISLCCTGLKADAYGFKWRFYQGPFPIDWDTIKSRQMSLEELRAMQVIRGKRVYSDGPGAECGGGGGGDDLDFRMKGGRPRKGEVEQFDREVNEARAKAAVLAADAAKAGLVIQPGGLAYSIATGNTNPAMVSRPPEIVHLSSSSSTSSHLQQPAHMVLPSRPTASASTPVASSSSAGVVAMNLPVSPQLVSSTVLVSARLAKLKSELVSIIYMIPEKSMKFVEPEQDKEKEKETAKKDTEGTTASGEENKQEEEKEDGEKAAAVGAVTTTDMEVVEDSKPKSTPSDTAHQPPAEDKSEGENKKVGEAAMDVVIDGAGSSSTSSSSSAEPAVKEASEGAAKEAGKEKEQEESKESKQERKIKRRAKRKANFERVMKAIQEATTPAELFVVFSEIEAAVPPNLRYTINDDALPTNADSCALLATRIYALDRTIRYADIKEVDIQGAVRAYRPRTHFVPRCLVCSACSKLACHIGKCTIESPLNFNQGFRTTDILENSLSVYVEAQRLRMSLSSAQLTNLLPPTGGFSSGLGAIAAAPLPNPQMQQLSAAAAFARKQAANTYAQQVTAQARLALLARNQRAEENEEENYRRRMEMARRRDLMIGLDIELIVPFFPQASELKGDLEWV